MKTLGQLLSLLLFLGVLGAGAAAPPPDITTPAVTATGATTRATAENRVITLTNRRRANHGCPRLDYRWSLVKAARNHSDRMADAQVMSHQLFRELGLGARVTAAGYLGWASVRENIGYGYYWPWQIVRAWMNSATHRHAMLDCSLRHVGIGMVYRNGIRWWTMDMGHK